jgi:hypothetical protein
MVEKFKATFIAHVPDADPAKHRCVIKTSLYKLTSVLVKNDDEAVEVCRELAQKEGVHAFILCPGFTPDEHEQNIRQKPYVLKVKI